MKKTKTLLMLMLCFVAASVFTSCLNDDDNNNSITADQAKAAMLKMQGTYAGKLISSNKDTVQNLAWRSDSVIKVANFPLKTLAGAISGDDNKDLKAALIDANTAILKCSYGFISVSDPYVFLVSPQSLKLELTYGGKTHEVIFAFSVYNYNYSIGEYVTSTSKMSVLVTASGMYVDGSLSSAFSTEQFMLVSDTKY